MERKNVSSSNIKSIGYDENAEELEVEFKSGDVYEYFNVPVDKYKALMSALSIGTYFAANVRDKYKYRIK